jgi:hypothetical protein
VFLKLNSSPAYSVLQTSATTTFITTSQKNLPLLHIDADLNRKVPVKIDATKIRIVSCSLQKQKITRYSIIIPGRCKNLYGNI